MPDTTTDHDTIRRWAEKHGGKLALVFDQKSNFNKIISRKNAQ